MPRPLPGGFAPERILIIQLRQIGDVLLTTPAIRALRKKFPAAKISFLAEPLPAKVLWGNKNLDEIILRDPKAGGLAPLQLIRDIRARRFGLIIDFLANPRASLITFFSGAQVTVSWDDNRRSFLYSHPAPAEGVYAAERKLSLLRVLGVPPEPATLDMAVPDPKREKMEKWLAEAGVKNGIRRAGGNASPLVILEAFAKWPVLTYPAAAHARLAEMMAEKWGAEIIVSWGPGREQDARDLAASAKIKLHVAPATDLHELAALYRMADLWVGNDCGPRHIAASQSLPTFAVFGPTDDAWTPPGPHLSAVRRDLACVPCNQRFCPEKHHACLAAFPPEEVFPLLEQFWSRVKAP